NDVIERSLPAAPATDSEANVLAEWNALYDAYNEVACLMLGSMTPELHRIFENYSPYEMLQELKSMFEKLVRVERFDLIKTFHACKQEEGNPVAAYVLQMKGYINQLERLGYLLPQDIIVGLILNDLTKHFVRFVRNYNTHNIRKTIDELHAILIEYEKGLPKNAETPQDKPVYIPKPKNPKPAAKEHPSKDDTCHHCKEVGHWKRNCPIYFAELLKKKKQVGSANSSENCHYATSITRGVVSVHRLVENIFVQCFTDFGILVSKNNVFYFNAIPSNGIYEIDMHDLVPNDNSIYNGITKRANYNLDSTYPWHCRLAHISKKRIEKLQQEGLLKSIDDESFDQCVSCLSGKMTYDIMGYYFYFPPENKIVVARYAEFFKKNLITQEVSGRAVDLEEIQDNDTSPSEIITPKKF
nr:hypothetical protein [Tanacetum cinerariifolium]